MNKRRPSLDPSQLGFTFDPPQPAREEADLAGLGRIIAAGVGRALREEPRDRFQIASEMSRLLDEDVTKWMLDAYASEARGEHNISAARFLALIAVTDRFDILDHATRKVGAALLVGEEIALARAGHLRAQIEALKDELKETERQTRPIGRLREE